MIDEEATQDSTAPFSLLLEFVPDQLEESDPAFIHAIGRETIEALQNDGNTVSRVYTGKQGGDFLVEIVPVVSHFVTTLQNNKAVIEEVMNDTSALITLSVAVLTVVNKVKQVYEQHVGHAQSLAQPVKITLELNGASITIEAPDLTQVQAQALIKTIVQQTQDTSAPPQKISKCNTLKVQPHIPRKKNRRRK